MSSYYVIFDDSFLTTLAYMSQYYAEEKDMQQAVPCIPCGTYSMEQTVYIIMFTNFEVGNLLSEKRNDAESGEIFDDD